uniref:ISXO2-like transposase domain-containing protein n=1 Tax=Amphimedon queenslandica TaxID=400682 RepID=A0A1X7UTL8_AMPQE
CRSVSSNIATKSFKHVGPGTTIISDEWRAYSTLASRGMIHLTVNHSLIFINPMNSAHTQSIQSTWSQVKKNHA